MAGFDLGAFAGGIGQGIEQGEGIRDKYRKRVQEIRVQKANEAAAMVQSQRAAGTLAAGGAASAAGAAPQLAPPKPPMGAPPAGGAPSQVAPQGAPPLRPPMGAPPPQMGAPPPGGPPKPVPMPGAQPMPQPMSGGAPPQAPPMPGGGVPPPHPPAPQQPPPGAPPPGGPPGGGAADPNSPFAGLDVQRLGNQYKSMVQIGQQHFTATMKEVLDDAKRAGKKITPLEAMDAATALVQNEDLDPTLKSLMLADVQNNKAQMQFVLGNGKLDEKTADDASKRGQGQERIDETKAWHGEQLTLEEKKEKARMALQGVIGSQRLKQIEAQGSNAMAVQGSRNAGAMDVTNARDQTTLSKDDFDEAVKQLMQDNNLDDADARAQIGALVKEYGAQVANPQAGQRPAAPDTAIKRPVRAPLARARGGPPPPPKVGDIVQGHRFKGGDPSKSANWVPVQ